MSDYGHELKFGSFITPIAQQAHDVVELAVLSETAGLDLVTFQDHPYQTKFLDTWTLLSYVAAKTSRVSLAGNVLNLPLRPPAVLARAMASLDLLSNGRAELGLGAGAFWDGIAAMGGTRLMPGDAVSALEESLDIIRDLWNVEEPGGVRFQGQFHQIDGARRGPAPAHRISIWLGALKPRMLDLIGRKADGWLPSLGRIASPGIAEANAIIDAAATTAGRQPADIRRMLNLSGSPLSPQDRPALIEQITELAIDHGFSTFILPADTADPITVFGNEIAPAVREAVAKARASRG
ncbi:MAG: 5,10-methylene tetrahydromethanopterin reductase [Pelagibacterium sp. SCN 64-44]|nr:MAG: 5,10-methylene tetrahydromethanopterin reductase [Pelagibacterium sp. SCN 64-44]